MDEGDLTPGQRRMLPAQRARKWRKFHRWAQEMRQHGWVVVSPNGTSTTISVGQAQTYTVTNYDQTWNSTAWGE